MTEIRGIDGEQTVHISYEYQNHQDESGTSFWREDIVVLILAGFTAICAAGLLLLIAVPILALAQNVIGVNLPGLNSVIRWLSAGSKGLILAIALAFSGVVFYLALRHRLLHNAKLYADTGCPRCREHELIRVRRQRNDRIVSRLRIPVRRYVCRNCSWDGLRIGGPVPVVESDEGPVQDQVQWPTISEPDHMNLEPQGAKEAIVDCESE